MRKKYKNWYSVKKVNNNLFVLEEKKSLQHNSCFLLIGSKRSLMIDTGTGENRKIEGTKIMYEISKLNKDNLPLTLLLTHFHFDHNQNMSEFENVAFPKLKMLEERMEEDIFHFKKEDLAVDLKNPDKCRVNEWLQMEEEIDLGNLKIELIHVPGHAPESIAIIDKTNKVVILGDLLYNFTMFVLNEEDLVDYKNSFDKLLSKVDETYKFFGSHMEPEVSFERVTKAHSFLKDINSNDKDVSVKRKSFGKTKFDIYKKDDVKLIVFISISKRLEKIIVFFEKFVTRK